MGRKWKALRKELRNSARNIEGWSPRVPEVHVSDRVKLKFGWLPFLPLILVLTKVLPMWALPAVLIPYAVLAYHMMMASYRLKEESS